MKRSKILLIVLFIITAALGGAAIFIGYRLSQEEDVTPEESEARGGHFVCVIKHGPADGPPGTDPGALRTWRDCNELGSDEFYAFGNKTEVRNLTHCTILQDDSRWHEDGWLMPQWDFIGPFGEGRCECKVRSDGTDNCGKCEDAIKSWDMGACAKCGVYGTFATTGSGDNQGNENADPAEPIDFTWSLDAEANDGTYKIVINRLHAINYWPHIPGGLNNGSDVNDYKARINLEESGLEYKVSVTDSQGNNVFGPEKYDWRNAENVNCSKDPSATGSWFSKGHHPANKRVICNASGLELKGLDLQEGETYRLKSSIRITQASWGETFSWQTSDACNASFSVQQTDFSCDNLQVEPSSLTTQGGDVTLTTSASASGVTIDSYDYGASIGTISGNTDTATWNIPSGTDEGTYSAWVNVTASDGRQSGCTDAGTCTDDGQGCQVDLQVTDANYAIEKSAEVDCVEDPNPPEGYDLWYEEAIVTYTITVRNVSNADGGVEYVEDTYDSRYQTSWIAYIEGYEPDRHEGNVLTWDNGGQGYDIAAGNEITFQYRVVIPEDYLGELDAEGNFTPYIYENVALALPRGADEPIRADEDVVISCPPSTGLFDNTITAALMALLLVMVGIVSIRYSQQVAYIGEVAMRFKPLSAGVRLAKKARNEIRERLMYTRKQRFERKVSEDRDED